MGLRELLAGPDINRGLEEFKNTPGAVLMDVRTAQEYAEGHIPGSINVPLQTIAQVEETVPEMDTPVFVYCLSGARSRRAAVFLEKLGYSEVQNIGGISAYQGPISK